MNIFNRNPQQGIVKTIILIVIALLFLSYLGFDLRRAAEDPKTRSNFSYAIGFATTTWNTYLARPASYLWNDVFIDLIWTTAIDNLENIRDGKSTSIEHEGPKLPSTSKTSSSTQ